MKKLLLSVAALLLVAGTFGYRWVRASDHDDGEINEKGRSLNLTDVYIFKESAEVSTGSSDHVVFIVNTNPRSLPKQQYYFSTDARYEIHVSRAGTSKTAKATTNDDLLFRFTFQKEDSTGNQAIEFTMIRDGQKWADAVTTDINGTVMKTTSLAEGSSPRNHNVNVGGSVFRIFAGLRQDPFFFDVTKFFKGRAAAAQQYMWNKTSAESATSSGGGTGGTAALNAFLGQYNGTNSVDFTSNYNVNSIALRVPTDFLQTSNQTVFDAWATISIPETM